MVCYISLWVCGARPVCGDLGFWVFSYLPLVSLLCASKKHLNIVNKVITE